MAASTSVETAVLQTFEIAVGGRLYVYVRLVCVFVSVFSYPPSGGFRAHKLAFLFTSYWDLGELLLLIRSPSSAFFHNNEGE
jgi:hypothetical protein